MIFGPNLVGKVLDGTKTVTRRRLTHRDGRDIRYRVGHTYAVQPGRGKPHVGHIRVLSVLAEPLCRMTDWDLRNEGFESRFEFESYWQRLHGSYDPDEPVAVIRFELADRCPKCKEWVP